MKLLWIVAVVLPLVVLGVFYYIRKQKNVENKEDAQKFWFIISIVFGVASALALLIAYSISDKVEYLFKMALPLLIILIPFMNKIKKTKKIE